MTENSGIPDSLRLSKRLAIGNAMEHYGNVSQAITTSMANVFAFFNAGALAAAAALLSSPFGQKMLAEMGWQTGTTMILFVVGLILALILKGLILLFSISRYRFYRELLARDEVKDAVPPRSTMILAGVTLFVCVVIVTIVAIGLSIIVVYNTPRS